MAQKKAKYDHRAACVRCLERVLRRRGEVRHHGHADPKLDASCGQWAFCRLTDGEIRNRDAGRAEREQRDAEENAWLALEEAKIDGLCR